MQKEIRHTWLLQHSPERVWEYLTRAELITQWLMDNDFKPVVGHKFMFSAKPVPQFGFDGNIFCEVLEAVPCRVLSYSWKGGPGDGVINLDTVVKWTLTPKGDDTELLLEHTGFESQANDMAFTVMNMGWGDHIGKRFSELLNKTDHDAASH